MATINEIKQQAAAVKNATQVGENTAERVGGALAGLAEIAEQQDTELGKKFDKESILQESGEAEDKVMSQKATTNAIAKVIGGSVDLSKYQEYVGFFNNSNIIKTSGYGFKLIPIKGFEKISVTANSTNSNTLLLFLQSIDYTHSTYVKSTGAEFIIIHPEESLEENIPSDANFLYIQTTYNSNAQSFDVEVNGIIKDIKILERKVEANTHSISLLNTSFENIESTLDGTIDIRSLTEYVGFFMNASISKTSGYGFKLIPLSGIDKIIVKSDSDNSVTQLLFLQSMNYDNSTFIKSNGTEFIRLENGQTISSDVPADANYLYIQTTYDSKTQTFDAASEKLIQKVNELQNEVQELENKISDVAKKRIAILGDSYSAYKGWNSGDDSYAYYDDEDTRNTGISSVTKMWWYQVIRAKNYIFEKCNSLGGTTICNTGYNGNDYSAISFISDRKENIGNPDLLIIFGGTNDSWAESPIGVYQYSDWTDNDLKKFRPAVAYLIDWMQLHHPNMDIVIVGNSTTSSDYTSSLQTIAEHYNLPFVLPSPISTVNGHPNENGMNQIANAVLRALS